MELTDSYDERSALFGLKTLFQFVGYAATPSPQHRPPLPPRYPHPPLTPTVPEPLPRYAATPLLNIGLSALLADDLVALYSMLALAVGSLAVLAWASLLCNVGERPPPPEAHTPSSPPAAGLHPVLSSLSGARWLNRTTPSSPCRSCRRRGACSPTGPTPPSGVSSPVWVQSRGWCGTRRVLANKPYLVYLLMKMPLSLVSLMPSNLAALWVKHKERKKTDTPKGGGWEDGTPPPHGDEGEECGGASRHPPSGVYHFLGDALCEQRPRCYSRLLFTAHAPCPAPCSRRLPPCEE